MSTSLHEVQAPGQATFRNKCGMTFLLRKTEEINSWDKSTQSTSLHFVVPSVSAPVPEGEEGNRV
jgi:hypothetical protein